MALWKKIALFTLLAVAALGIRVYLIWRERNTPIANPHQQEERALTSDEIVQPRKLYIDSLASARALDGKTVWMQAGYELAYYPYVGGRIDFAKRAGLIAPTQAMAIEKIIEAKAPASTRRLVPLGTRQVFAIYTMPGDAKQYATAIGYEQGADSTYYCDEVFFYDDPHTLYKHWPAAVWKAVDAHQAQPGMNERQVAMSLGMIQTSDSMNPASYGNRTVSYATDAKRWVVTFANDKVTHASATDEVAP
jgi:hypothetical protein